LEEGQLLVWIILGLVTRQARVDVGAGGSGGGGGGGGEEGVAKSTSLLIVIREVLDDRAMRGILGTPY